jgi:hypothetical protein
VIVPTLKVSEVPASRGAAWLALGFGLFRARPMAWIGLCCGWIAITFGLLVIPFLGGVLANFLQPVFFASFAITAARQVAGDPVMMGDLFTGFRRNVRALVNLGALLLFAQIAILVLVAVLGLPTAVPGNGPFVAEDYVEALSAREWGILALGFLLTAAVKAALWFAPPLIAFHDLSTLHAIRWSVYAALENLGAMIVYGLALLALVVLGSIPWGLGLLVVIPMMAISTFFGYREVFAAAPEEAPKG